MPFEPTDYDPYDFANRRPIGPSPEEMAEMLRAVGAKRRQIRRMIVAESLLLSLMGIALGIISGIMLSYVMTGVLEFAGMHIPYNFPTAGLITAIAAGLICGILAALIPARRASDLQIVAALAYE